MVINEKNCYFCGESKVLHRHHIDGNKKNNDSENLVYLCPTCHAKVHKKKIEVSKTLQYDPEIPDSDRLTQGQLWYIHVVKEMDSWEQPTKRIKEFNQELIENRIKMIDEKLRTGEISEYQHHEILKRLGYRCY